MWSFTGILVIKFLLIGVDSSGKLTKVAVSSLGQLITAPFAYDETVFKELAEVNTAYNFYEPKAGQQFVITGIIFRADKQVSSVSDATVIVYEATSISETTVDKVLLQFAVVQDAAPIITALNILVNKGRWINAKTTDDDIHMTITGYYIPAL